MLRHCLFTLALLILLPILLGAETPVNPGADWVQVIPESQGYSTEKLEVLRAWLKTEPTAAMMVIKDGKVIVSYGDTAHVSKIASVRKSIAAILMGKYVVSGKLDTYKSVKELGLEDRIPFTEREEHANLEQLMTARSGINRDLPDDLLTSQQPPRGSAWPGVNFAYNNWEFDAAGVALEHAAGMDIYDLLENDLAAPLGMQDFHRERQHKVPEPASNFPEYAMFLSTRDMARIGRLMLNDGVWNGKPLLDPNWVRSMTDIWTPWEEMEPPILRLRGAPERWGFGFGWWVWDAKPFPGNSFWSGSPFQGAYEARGTGGQYITVIPARGLVLIHKVDIDVKTDANLADWPTITSIVLASACAGPCPVSHSGLPQ